MGHFIIGSVITGPAGTGSTIKQKKYCVKKGFKNAWKQGNISTQVSSYMLHVCSYVCVFMRTSVRVCL